MFCFSLRLRIFSDIGYCVVLYGFEDSAEFPSCSSYFSVSAYFKNVLSFRLYLCLVGRSGEIVVKLRVGTHCDTGLAVSWPDLSTPNSI